MRRRIFCASGLLAITMLLTPGCGDAESVPSAPGPSAASQPLQGKAPSQASQFQGVWLCQTDGPLTGLEFVKDQKVLVTATLAQAMRGDEAIMLSYDVLEGGRLSLTAPTGQTDIYQVVLAGDEMELSTANGQSERYRRLPSGQTLPEAARSYHAQRVQAFEAQVQAVSDRLTQDGLVLVVHPEGSAPSQGAPGTPGTPGTSGTPGVPGTMTVALHLQGHPSHGYQGVAYHQGQRIGASPAEVKLATNPQTFDLTLHVALRDQTAPATLRPWTTKGQFALKAHPQADGSWTLAGPIRLGTQAMTATLMHDAPRHQAILTQYQEEKARLEAAKRPLIEALREYAILRGQAVTAQAQATTTDQIILIRQGDAQSPRWQGEIQTDDGRQQRTYPFSQASVQVLDDQAELIVPGLGRIYRLALDAGWKGHWQASANQPGQPVTMELIEATDKATFDARVAAQRQAILSITQDQVFHGLVPAYGDSRPASPVVLRMAIGPDGGIAASAYYTLFRSEVTMQGRLIDTLTGPAIELAFKDIPAGQRDVRVSANMLSMQIRHRKWRLRLDSDAPARHFTGHIQGGQGGAIDFLQRTETWKPHHDALRTSLLEKGVTLNLTQPVRKGAAQPFHLRLELDPATGQVTGQILSMDRQLSQVVAQATTVGSLQDIGPWSGMTLEFTPPPTARNTRLRHTMELIVLQRDGRPILTGVFYPNHAPQAEEYIELQPFQP